MMFIVIAILILLHSTISFSGAKVEMIPKFRIQLRRPRFYPGLAERAICSIPGIRRRRGQGVRAGFFFCQAAEGNAAGATGERIGSDLNGPLHHLAVGIYEFCRYGLAGKC